MVASDAAARGIDVEHIKVVVNYDPPPSIKAYVHRVGRTARAGRKGSSYSLLCGPELRHFKHSMAKAGKSWRPLQLPHVKQALDDVSVEYAAALHTLQRVLELERSGALAPHVPMPTKAAGGLCDGIAAAGSTRAGSAVSTATDSAVARTPSVEEEEWQRLLRAQLHARLDQRRHVCAEN
uniref:Helicase C-terminal domain-containing protein n=1 Tax=Calcidiscus leptoporus TaxID=127549 RepID=A0A7S0ISP1_9EUKA|mmetsp:Transcript_20882/g.48157  ORF Transcript_20882/g.48157 Transcript_20882/m.48157 type:complete len:180 (+) Transcript_20882:257-796(+)